MVRLRRLSSDDGPAADALWQRAQERRMRDLGRESSDMSGGLARDGLLAVGLFEADALVAIACAAPAREDDGHSARVVPGLVHVYGVATDPDRWGRGLAGRALRGVLSLADRHGYARASLWTYESNPTSQRLYESAGFVRTGRAGADDRGEVQAQWMRAISHPVVSRPAARVICLDRAGRVLLQRYRDPVDGFEFFEPPGGGLEAGESPIEAALREWDEETALPRPRLLSGPVDVGRDVLWAGRRGVVDEQMVLAHLDDDQPAPPASVAQAADMDAYLGHAWVPPAALVGGRFDGAFVDPDIPVVLDRLRCLDALD